MNDENGYLGNQSAFDYWMGNDTTTQPAELQPSQSPADWANAWTNESAFTSEPAKNDFAATVTKQPGFFDTVIKGVYDVGGGIWKGAGEVAVGMAPKLAESFAGILAQKMGMQLKPAVGADGKVTYYPSPAEPGVPPATPPPSTTIVTGGGSGIAGSTVAIIIAGAALVYLIAKSR